MLAFAAGFATCLVLVIVWCCLGASKRADLEARYAAAVDMINALTVLVESLRAQREPVTQPRRNLELVALQQQGRRYTERMN